MKRIVYFVFFPLILLRAGLQAQDEGEVFFKGERMDISVVKQVSERKKSDVMFLPFWQEEKKAVAAYLGNEFSGALGTPLAAGDFCGKEGETLVVYPEQGSLEKRLVLVGLGDKKNDFESYRRSYAAGVAVARKMKCRTASVCLPAGDEKTVKAVCDGVFLSNYTFDELKEESLKENPTVLLEKIHFVGADKKMLPQMKRQGLIAEGVYLARDLINNNADNVTPQAFGAEAKRLAKKFSKITATVFGKKEIEKHKMGLLLAVNRGSDKDPTFIVMEYRGNPSSKETTAIVGKGITYDSGGLNLKPTGSMETMKCDMSGAAAVFGTMYAAAAMNLKANIIGVVPATENSIGPGSYKPGDVFKSYSGKTVEINNTDAEGRLILADALSYTVKNLKPTRIIDMATLTGAIVVALGEQITGMFTNDDQMAKELSEAGEATGDFVWRQPLVADYKEQLKSPIADMKNCGSRHGGSITAALFLESFVEKTPWTHLDIAGTAHHDPKYYHTTHATGAGVRLLIEYLGQ